MKKQPSAEINECPIGKAAVSFLLGVLFGSDLTSMKTIAMYFSTVLAYRRLRVAGTTIPI